MNKQTETFHRDILRVLDHNNTRFGLAPQNIGVLLEEFGHQSSSDEVGKALDYLEQANFVAQVNKAEFHPENRTWKIHLKGTNYLRERGF